MSAKREKDELKLKFARPIKRAEIPVVLKGGVIHSLEAFKDITTIAQYVKDNGVSPYEAFDVADFEEIRRKNPEVAKMKTLVTSFVLSARKILKQFQVDKKLQLTVRKERVFLESLE